MVVYNNRSYLFIYLFIDWLINLLIYLFYILVDIIYLFYLFIFETFNNSIVLLVYNLKTFNLIKKKIELANTEKKEEKKTTVDSLNLIF